MPRAAASVLPWPSKSARISHSPPARYCAVNPFQKAARNSRNRFPRALSLQWGIAPEPRSGTPAVGPELAATGGAGILASAPRSTPASCAGVTQRLEGREPLLARIVQLGPRLLGGRVLTIQLRAG
ncbi:hypothetical protein RS82_02579 [Microbacterium trichothecenolyticum]|uniref:Uncharacterized protein n=1 Tax=Microbacterium trichothecenolyticum TaxID=69370 RepID=A0A0M2HCQ0_MICTR|nr:hypothetical protein RS82_02579 [Microbacterium trichothecenolyticum]